MNEDIDIMSLQKGDLISCGAETGVVLSVWCAPNGSTEVWCHVLWNDGIEPIPVDDIDKIIAGVNNE